MTKFESSVKVIPYSQERVYAKISDLSHLEALKDRLPQDKVKDLSFDSDTLSFSVSPVGQLTLQVVEREGDYRNGIESVYESDGSETASGRIGEDGGSAVYYQLLSLNILAYGTKTLGKINAGK